MADLPTPPRPGLLAANIGEPIRLSEVIIHGVAASSMREGEVGRVWTRMAVSSDQRNFHRIADNLCAAIEHCARKDGKSVSLKRADTILLVMKADNTAELWVDTAAVAVQCLVKRDMAAGSVVFENDIGDVTGMDFPMVEIGATDRVICIFRQDWRFGLYFDFNPEGAFDRKQMNCALGTLYRTLRYRHLYDALSDQELFQRLIASGWFPFVELLGDFREIADSCEAGFDLRELEERICARFDDERIERIFARWMAKPHFKERETVLREAVNAYLSDQPVAAIKIILTEIEGVLFDAYRAVHGKGAKIKKLLDFAIQSAEAKAGAPDTLLFPAAFAHYLANHTFANFDPDGPRGNAGSRHAVGHGAALAGSYTKPRALQALLTLDQIGFYT